MSISPVNAFSDLSQDMMCEIARRCDLSSAIALRGVSKGISNMVVNKSPGDHSVLIDVLKNHLNLNKPNSIIPFSITSNPLELATKLMCKGSIDVKWIPTELTGHKGCVTSVAFSPDGSQIVSSSLDKTCRVWTKNLEGKWDSIELSGHKECVKSVAFSPDGSQIVSGSYDKTCRIWVIKRANKD